MRARNAGVGTWSWLQKRSMEKEKTEDWWMYVGDGTEVKLV